MPDSELCNAALENAGNGLVFAAAVRAIEEKYQLPLNILFALADAVPEVRPGLFSAWNIQPHF